MHSKVNKMAELRKYYLKHLLWSW